MAVSTMQPFSSAAMRDVIQERDDAKAALEEARNPQGVTVCVPVFNDYTHLQQTLDSISAQTVQPLEVLVIDDGSGPPQSRVIKQMADSHGFDYYRVTNRGLPNARNTAIMLAKGHAFLPLDADDWIDETYIAKTLPLLEGHDVVLTGLKEHGPDRQGQYMPGYDRHFSEVTAELLTADYNRFFYASLIRVSLLREVGGYHGKMAGGWGVNGGYEDWDLWIDLKKRNARFAACHEYLFNYRTRADGMLAAAERNRQILVEEIHRHHS
jgi:glycosyltransferase involved in cell wall biosynthesis